MRTHPLTPTPAQVEVFRKQDARRGVRVAQVLEGFISRKVVKQTVMTVVYGVTRYGGRLQIERRLRELSTFPQVRLLDAWLHGSVGISTGPGPAPPRNSWPLGRSSPGVGPPTPSLGLPFLPLRDGARLLGS